MSAIGVILVIAVVILSVARRLNQMQGNGRGQRPPTQMRPQQRPQPRPQPRQEQSAWDWMHSSSQTAPDARDLNARGLNARDPEGETLMYRDVPEDWIRPVEATVRVDLTEMHETQREVVHESVHESLHIRRDATADTTRKPPRQPGKIGLNHANLAQALILAETLGEPRSKRPWKPQNRR